MDIVNCDNLFVKFGKTSLSVKDINGKLKGIVKDVLIYPNIPARKLFDIVNIIRKKELYDCRENEHFKIIVKDNEIYYFYNLYIKDFYEKTDLKSVKDEYYKYENDLRIINDLKNKSVPVVFSWFL